MSNQEKNRDYWATVERAAARSANRAWLIGVVGGLVAWLAALCAMHFLNLDNQWMAVESGLVGLLVFLGLWLLVLPVLAPPTVRCPYCGRPIRAEAVTSVVGSSSRLPVPLFPMKCPNTACGESFMLEPG